MRHSGSCAAGMAGTAVSLERRLPSHRGSSHAAGGIAPARLVRGSALRTDFPRVMEAAARQAEPRRRGWCGGQRCALTPLRCSPRAVRRDSLRSLRELPLKQDAASQKTKRAARARPSAALLAAAQSRAGATPPAAPRASKPRRTLRLADSALLEFGTRAQGRVGWPRPRPSEAPSSAGEAGEVGRRVPCVGPRWPPASSSSAGKSARSADRLRRPGPRPPDSPFGRRCRKHPHAP